MRETQYSEQDCIMFHALHAAASIIWLSCQADSRVGATTTDEGRFFAAIFLLPMSTLQVRGTNSC